MCKLCTSCVCDTECSVSAMVDIPTILLVLGNKICAKLPSREARHYCLDAFAVESCLSSVITNCWKWWDSGGNLALTSPLLSPRSGEATPLPQSLSSWRSWLLKTRSPCSLSCGTLQKKDIICTYIVVCNMYIQYAAVLDTLQS